LIVDLAKTVDIQSKVVERRSRNGVVWRHETEIGEEEVIFIYEFVCEPRSESYLKMNLASKATSHLDGAK